MSKKVFKEKQRFNNTGFIGLFWFFIIGFGYVLISEFIRPTENSLYAIAASLIAITLSIIALVCIKRMSLKTTITDQYISFQLKPFQVKKYKILLEEVEECTVVNTPAIAMWQGSNISFNNEKFYSFSGRNGVAINTSSGEQYFIGTNRLKDLEKAIRVVLG